MAQGLVAQVCNEVNVALLAGNALKLQSILVIEPPFSPIYQQLISTLRNSFPSTDTKATERLEKGIRAIVTEAGEGEDAEGRPVQSWGALITFLAAWLTFIRDVNVDNLLTTYEGLSDLQQKANSAFQHPTKGVLLLPTLVGYSKVFARVAIGLDRHPELIQHLLDTTLTDEGRRESLAEKAANIIRNAFITCLNDRTTVHGGIRNGKPDGKKAGIYKMANVCLKILFQADKIDNCQTIFKNITQNSPPLDFYPASERVTYLYYLGRALFAGTHFYQAQLALQKAYDDCTTHESCRKQRRLILIYLISANIILGRFPTDEVYSRPEAQGLWDIFSPFTEAIRKGDLETFRRITKLDLSFEHAGWLFRRRILMQFQMYCEALVWRSLFRKVFLLAGQQGATERSAPTLDLNVVLAACTYLEKRAQMPAAMAQQDGGPGRRHISFVLQDFTPRGWVHPEFEGLGLEPYIYAPKLDEIECICASLVTQGFLHGYISHKSKRFAIQGVKKAGSAVKAGFPSVSQIIKAENVQAGGDRVEGWVTEMQRIGGNVVRLAGAKLAGS